jgi:hypothetical protein
MGYEDWKWEYGEWSYELGAAEAGWLAFGEWEFTAAWGAGNESGHIDIYVVEYRYLKGGRVRENKIISLRNHEKIGGSLHIWRLKRFMKPAIAKTAIARGKIPWTYTVLITLKPNFSNQPFRI